MVNGYAGGSLYARMKGQLWIRQLIVGAFLVPSIICGVTFLVNFISIYYGSSRSIPFTVMVRELPGLTESFLFVLVECHGHLSVHHPTVDSCGNCSGKEHQRRSELSMPNKCSSTTDTGKEMVRRDLLDLHPSSLLLLIRFMEPNVIILASGILPFGSIFIEM